MFKHPLLYVWIVLAAMFVAGGLIRPASEGPYVGQDSTKRQGTEDRDGRAGMPPAAAGRQRDPQAEIHSPDCEKPEDGSDANLCLMRRATKAAEAQSRINSIGLGVLAATLLATFVAAVAAWNTVRTMRETAKIELRPYLIVRPSDINFDGFGRPVIQVIVQNVGKTAALRVQIFGRLEVLAHPWPAGRELPFVGETNQPVSFTQPGERSDFPVRLAVPLTQTEIADVTSAQVRRVYAHGRVVYEDRYGDQHETPFGMSVSGGPRFHQILLGNRPASELPSARFEYANLTRQPT
jgi:hypothetical protein